MDIAVVIPAYNRPEMLLRAVESVLSQTTPPKEFVVVDDGSGVNLSVVHARVEAAGHRFLSGPNSGVAHARNRGIHATKSDWIAFLDSDDYWLPEKLACQSQYLANNPDLRIAQCQEIWYRDGIRVNPGKAHVMRSGDIFLHALKVCAISSSSVVMHRSIFDAIGTFDENLVVCEDYDLWLRVTAKFKIGLLEPALTVKFGGHADQLSKSQVAMDRFRVYSLLKLLRETKLTVSQETAVWKVLKQKCRILAAGARKRGQVDTAVIYEAMVCEQITKPNTDSDLAILLSLGAQ